MSGAQVGSNLRRTLEGFFPLDLLEMGNKVANVIDSSLMGKKGRAPATVAREHRIEPFKYLGVLVLAFPHLKPTATSWPERRV